MSSQAVIGTLRPWRHFVLFLSLLVGAPAVASAQIGQTTDIITGTVRAENGAPLEGAQVEVTSAETGVTRRARTNAKGLYTILFPDGGGEYQVVIRSIGLAPQSIHLMRLADEDRLVADAMLTMTSTQLNTVAVTARPNLPTGNDLPTPGSIERAMTPEQAARLPIDASDLLNLALLSPSVVSIIGTDTTAAGFSVAGMRPDANAVTLDGLSFGSTQMPAEATRTTRVITSTYDVSRGQFSGGLIASTTRSGTNTLQGNFGYSLRDNNLEIGAQDPSVLAQGYTQNQLSGGIGRAIIKDNLFAFASYQIRRREDVLPSLYNADASTLARYAVSPDSVARFMNLVNGYGLTPGEFFQANRFQNNLSGLLRVDWLMPNGNSLSVRGDWRSNNQDPSRVGTLSLPQTGGTQDGWGGGIMATFTSVLKNRFLHEAKGYLSTNRNNALPFVTLPAGRVQVASDLTSDNTRGITTLTFGGNTGLPTTGVTNAFQGTDEISWLTPGHRFKLGGLFDISTFRQDQTSNRYGTYTFNSLEDFANGNATSYTRTLTPNMREGSQMNAAVYLGDVWRASRGMQVTYGGRVEGGRFGDPPKYNSAVEQTFGYNTSFVPKEIHFSPRVGFTWTVGMPTGAGGAGPGGGRGGGGGGGGRGGRGGGFGGGGFGGGRGGFGGGGFGARAGGPNPTIIRGGFGEFRSTVSSSLFSSAAAATGLSDAESQLVCTGDYTPQPDWAAFSADVSSLPTQCVGVGNQFTPTGVPSVTVFEKNFEAPRAWRASLGAQKRLLGRYSANVDFSLAEGVAQTGYTDLNLNTSPKFALGNEGGRPIFVDPSTIVPTSGTTNLLGSRLNPAFSQVLAINSNLRSRSGQMTIQIGGLTGRGAIFNFGYTLGYAWDQSSGGGFRGGFGGGAGGGGGGGSASGGFASATTAGNPNIREWAVSNFDRRHSLTGSLTWPVNLGLEVTAIGRLSSGAPFTPIVNSDINGDGARNDRAFIFDPHAANTDPAVAAAIQKLLDTSPAGVKECLQKQLGKLADRNSCRGVWTPSLEMQMNWRPGLMGLNRRLMVSITTQNLLGGIDQALHGLNNLHGWGVARGQDNTLLYVRGFDPTTNRYIYQVNERFGASRAGANGVQVPFQIGIQARYTMGPDRVRNAIDAVRGAAFGRGGRGGRAGGAGGGPGGFATALATFNPVASIIELKDSLQLSDDQVGKLQVIADSLNAKNASLAAEVRKDVESAGANPDMAALQAKMRPSLTKLQKNQQDALKEAQVVLTTAQWDKVPNRIRNGRGGGPGGARRPPGGT